MANHIHVTRFCIAFLISTTLGFSKLSSDAQMAPALFVFGDSLVDVGNNNHLPASVAKANFPHNGVDFPTGKPTGRFSNGKNAADLLAQKVGLPSSPPYLSLSPKDAASFVTGVSFASGGAGIFNGTDQTLGQAIPLTKQLSYYEVVYEALVAKMGSSGAQSLISKSLFFVVIGSNDLFDYSNSLDLQKKYTTQQYTELMASTLQGHLKKLFATGARKFVFAGVAPVGCIPARRARNDTEECDEVVNSAAVAYNGRLKSMLNELKSELKGFSYSYFESYSALETILQNPSNYGFSEAKAACCGLGKLKAEIPCVPVSTYCSNRRDHVFWDPYHPTEATVTILVDAIFDGSSDHTFPLNVRQLVAV